MGAGGGGAEAKPEKVPLISHQDGYLDNLLSEHHEGFTIPPFVRGLCSYISTHVRYYDNYQLVSLSSVRIHVVYAILLLVV